MINNLKRQIILIFVTFLSLVPGSSTETNREKPDILFIMVDDLNDWVGPLGGHSQVRTPNIDKLAARGMTFRNAHAPAPLCSPSRTALLTGLKPSTTGVYDNRPDWRDLDAFNTIPSLPKYFKEPLKMPSVAFLETETEKCDFPFPSFSITYVIKNGSISLCCTGTSNF